MFMFIVSHMIIYPVIHSLSTFVNITLSITFVNIYIRFEAGRYTQLSHTFYHTHFCNPLNCLPSFGLGKNDAVAKCAVVFSKP